MIMKISWNRRRNKLDTFHYFQQLNQEFNSHFLSHLMGQVCEVKCDYRIEIALQAIV